MKVKLFDITDGKLNKEEAEHLQNYFQKGGTWQHLLQLKDEEIEEIYASGYQHYNEKEYDKAITAFTALIQLNPYIAKNWIAIGAALQGKGEYRDALAAYELALAIDDENLATLFYCAQCSFALGEEQKSVEYLEKVISVGAKSGQMHEHVESASILLKALKKG
jgi:type III secretion system low calcium response chaperone LcrH/SycD